MPTSWWERPLRPVGCATPASSRRAFDQAAGEAYDKRAPNSLAEHAYRLAQSFSKFYAACPVLGADDIAVRASRLGLVQATLAQLELTLDLLGIETPEVM